MLGKLLPKSDKIDTFSRTNRVHSFIKMLINGSQEKIIVFGRWWRRFFWRGKEFQRSWIGFNHGDGSLSGERQRFQQVSSRNMSYYSVKKSLRLSHLEIPLLTSFPAQKKWITFRDGLKNLSLKWIMAPAPSKTLLFSNHLVRSISLTFRLKSVWTRPYWVCMAW